MKHNVRFQQQLQQELENFLETQKNKYPADELLTMDMHCHDYNSDVPDELIGRILGLPETWLRSEKLIKTLQKNGCDTFTVTNHNNSRSCYELINKGHDILVGAEFSVTVPDYKIGIHVLTYGFSLEEEKQLNKLRYNVYDFLQYTHEHNIPTIWAHPLYHYSVVEDPTFEFFSKMALIFERFEVLNGQRDTWQNMLVKNWITNLTPKIIDENAKKFNLDLSLYTNRPYQKTLSAGSDDHMGIFAGHSGSYLYVPNLKKRLKTTPRSKLALEAIRKHHIIPYGGHQNIEKLTIAFLDYLFQVAINMKKPDLLRMVLHKGTIQDKIMSIIVSNLFYELKHHKTTMHFIKLFHKSFIGKRPNKLTKLMLKKSYKSIFEEAIHIADAHSLEPDEMTREIFKSIDNINNQLNKILFKRLQDKINKFSANKSFKELSLDTLIDQIQLSPNIRDYTKFSSGDNKHKTKKITKFLDDLSFPLLSSFIILGANFTSSKVLYNTRKTLSDFSEHLGTLHHPKRMLWLTDTFHDKNSVSAVLQEIHREIKRLDLPIDILVCSNTIIPDEHLIVVKPEAQINLPFYQSQTINIPNVNKIHALFLENEYDRLICSTEGIMGLTSIMLKSAYSVPAYFYVHTDWIMFAKKIMKWNTHEADRIRRVLRKFYGNFDKLFVLNSDHKKWLSSSEMDINKDCICQTKHWVNEKFKPLETDTKETLGIEKDVKTLLFAGRFIEEKGVMDVIEIYKIVKKTHPDIKIIFAGQGPEKKKLKEELPNAIFLGWVENEKLPSIYSSVDILLLPSKFNTFGLVILEALSCGLPVATYNAKGPKDIIIHESCGYIASNTEEMAKNIISYLSDKQQQKTMKQNAIKRAKNFSKTDIMNQFMKDIDLEFV